MVRETSVVTPERFSQGFDYPSYMGQIKVNKARFEGFYNGLTLSSEDAAAFKELAQRPGGPAKMLVLGEDWCGDVIRACRCWPASPRPPVSPSASSPETPTPTSWTSS